MMQLADTKMELRAKVEEVNGRSVTIFSYMVSMTDTFDSPLAKEFRGTTFDNETKECICRPFPKFFNVGEKECTQPNLIDWANAKYFTKHDGSMLTPVLINNEIVWKTKNTFFSDVAIAAQNFYRRAVKEDPNRFPQVTEAKKDILAEYTPIFEYVGPTNQIVLPYDEEDLIFLGWRNIRNGGFVHSPKLEVKGVTYEQIVNMEEIEGFVIWDGNQLTKAKTMWYMERHKIASEFNVKAIIQATFDNTVDDMLGTIAQLGMTLRHFQVQQLRDKVVREQFSVTYDADMYYKFVTDQNLETRKEQAMYINSGVIPKEFRSIMFKKLDGKDTQNDVNKIVYENVYAEYKPTGPEE